MPEWDMLPPDGEPWPPAYHAPQEVPPATSPIDRVGPPEQPPHDGPAAPPDWRAIAASDVPAGYRGSTLAPHEPQRNEWYGPAALACAGAMSAFSPVFADSPMFVPSGVLAIGFGLTSIRRRLAAPGLFTFGRGGLALAGFTVAVAVVWLMVAVFNELRGA